MRKLLESLFFPSFLRRLDEKLLVERPSLWATRLHRVAWPAFLLLLCAIGLGLLTPIDRPSEIGEFVLMGGVLIFALQVTLVIFWMYGQDSYHLEREQGLRENRSAWREFGSWITALTMIGLTLFSFIATSQYRVRTVPKNTIAQDLVLLNSLQQMRDLRYSSHYDPDGRKKCMYSGIEDNFAGCLNNAGDMFVKGEFKRVSSSTAEQKFIEAYASAEDFVPLREQWRSGDYSAIIETIAKYDDDSLEDIAYYWDIETNPTGYVNGAKNSLSNDVLDFGYEMIWDIWGVYWLLVGTAAIHIALLRFTFKYAGKKWFLMTGAASLGLFFIPQFGSFMTEIMIGRSLSYQLFEWGSRLFGKSFLIYYPYGSWWHPTPFTTLCLLVALTLVIRLRKSTQFTSKTALALYILPLLFVCGSYLLLRLFEVHSENWFGDDFRTFYYRKAILWDFRLPEILRYTTQFGYVPFLGWLKQKHTRLMSLPRS